MIWYKQNSFVQIRGMYEMKKSVEQRLLELAEDCLTLGKTERPEQQWMEQVYDRFRAENGNLGKAEADQLLFRKMYAAEPAKGSDTLKIRYWRTGRHLPVSREQCRLFGNALQLSEKEGRFLLQRYCDRCDRVFESTSQEAVYQERMALLRNLAGEYLDKIHPAMKRQLYHSGADIAHSLRHLYYTDAKGYIRSREGEHAIQVGRHISSLNYMSEFGRQMKLLGEIPRKTMIRHLMIFANPFVNEEWLSRWLMQLGYLGLDENHTQADGSRLDRLLLGYLRLYRECCAGSSPAQCQSWLRQSSRILDEYLEKRKNTSLRLFYFKALKDWE